MPYVLIPVFIFLLATSVSGDKKANKDLQYYQVVEYFDKGEITEYELNVGTGVMKFQLKDGTKEKYTVPNVSIFVNDIHDGVVEYNRANPKTPIKYNYISGASTNFWMQMIPIALSIVLVVGLGIIFMKKMNNTITSENNRAMSFGKARVKFGKDSKRKTTFKEVAGADEEKDELQEIVEFLKDPKKFTELGARIPKGVLLVGPPGTGKTLLARAVAGEADVPFFSISGSDFLELYVGVGASRVRDLFDQAKKSAPAIIFIDEIDAVGRHRGAGMGGGHDEREQTLNQLLVEMDGFGDNEGITIIAATNRPDILDPALLRPGRFDRQVMVGRPDLKGREEILKVHSRNKPLAPDVDLKTVARGTVGFVGADLENLLNEAALLAARRNKKAVTMTEIDEAIVKVEVGTEKKSHKYTEKDKKMVAYHEAGHAVVAYYLENTDTVYEISIIPRGMAGGYTLYRPEEDSSYTSKTDMIENIISLMGGRVAEKIIGNEISTGPSSDISRASDVARSMVTRYGMSEKLGPIVYGKDNDQVFLGMDYNHTKNYSDSYATQIDDEIKKIVLDCEERCLKILTDHSDKLTLIAETLIKEEKIDKDTFLKLMDENYTEEVQNEESAQNEEQEISENIISEDADAVNISEIPTEENHKGEENV